MDSKETANAFLRIFFHILFKRKFLILAFFAITILITGISIARIETRYMVSSEILVKLGREHFYVPTSTDETFRPTISFSSIEQMNSEMQLIKSRPLIEQVIQAIGPTVVYEELIEKEPGILDSLRRQSQKFFNTLKPKKQERSETKEIELSKTDRAVLRIQDNLAVRAIKNSRVIQIDFEHNDPQVAAIVVERLVNAYLEARPQVYKNTQSNAFFQEQAKILKHKIDKTENALKDFKEQHDIIALNEERAILLQRKAELQSELNRSLSEKAETEKRIGQITHQLEATPSKIEQGENTVHNPLLISTLEEQLVTLELKERELLTKYTENNHFVQDVKKQLKIVRDKLAQQENKRYESTAFGPNPTHQRLNEDLFRNEAELQAINAKISTQKIHLAEYSERLDVLNNFEYKFKNLENRLEVDRENFKLYLTKLEETRISSEMDLKKIANVSVIMPAQMPLEPMDSNKRLFLAIGFFIAVFGSIGLAVFLEYFSEDLERPEEIEKLLGAPVLASVPWKKS
jgi:uncharacterized protein involved in exopolysaccharide biosynthesis